MPADLINEINKDSILNMSNNQNPTNLNEYDNVYDLVCIGAGPAGLTAGIYAARAGLKVLVLDQGAPGGKMLNTDEIENWPGTVTIKGRELASSMEEHALKCGAEIKWSVVKSIKNSQDQIKLIETMDELIPCKTIIIASGCKERHLNIPGEEEFSGMGVSYCAVCDGAFFKDGVIVVVGSGDSAFEEGDYLTRYAKKVYLFLRSERVHADKVFIERVENNPKIELRKNIVVEEILGDLSDGVKSVKLHNVKDDTYEELQCDAIFPFIGSDPLTNFVKDLDILDERSYIATDETMATSIPGIFAAGDCRSKILRQVVTASNDGAIAAQAVAAYIRSTF